MINRATLLTILSSEWKCSRSLVGSEFTDEELAEYFNLKVLRKGFFVG